ncbi:MAG: hypothetical protein JWP09_123 [Candidatus Taylorbacteria bacterium]|nr:hypothetical protein [Candidatus Taylorbacteria bacterium]
MQKITPFLWFDNNAEDAMKFYTSIFKNSKIISENRFELEGQEFLVLNGGPYFKFNEAISMFIDCKDQAEVDLYWNALLADGGAPSQCGWLKDKFGMSWQVIPSILGEYLNGSDKEKSGRVMDAMMKMVKIDVEALKNAYEGK